MISLESLKSNYIHITIIVLGVIIYLSSLLYNKEIFIKYAFSTILYGVLLGLLQADFFESGMYQVFKDYDEKITFTLVLVITGIYIYIMFPLLELI